MMRWSIAAGSAGAFAGLAIAVHVGLLNSFDATVRQWARPNDVWGTAQLKADLVVEGLRPTMLAILLAAFALAYCVKHRSLRPGAFLGGVCVATVVLTLAVKRAMERPDTHGLLSSSGGSFPSGHMISIIVCLGLAVLIALPKAGWWIWLIPAAGGFLMATALLLQAAHWATDVIGGGLLATAALAAAIASGWSRWALAELEDDHEFTAAAVSGAPPLTSVGRVAAQTANWISGGGHPGGHRLLRSWPGEGH
jgi:membrane-associated phospholipid phosphatase